MKIRLTQLKAQYKNLEAEVNAATVDISHKQKLLEGKKKILKTIKENIDRIENNGEIKISDHALVRYFERVKGYDLKEVEAEIKSNELMKFVDTLGGNGSYPFGEHKIIMKDFTVVTIA